MARSLILSNSQGILGCFSNFPKSYPAKVWLSVFTGIGARTSAALKSDFQSSPISKIEIRFRIKLRIQSGSQLKSPSLLLLPNSQIKNPFVRPSEVWIIIGELKTAD
ncbi:hypothetical protein AVEN_208383-1 [Araneus ventricosus]|uniref:Uncharacterized protein n=1 Tax=Araneus ventricosus TaxID=182803 RepID=A0A4Y2N4Q0_ARAVE|nr:hypothetical protein AVEN_208383-1 [Araneus ventricosus]